MIVICQVAEPEQALIPPLCELLIDTVHNGASVGFLAPLSIDRATRYWQQVCASLGEGLLLWVAETDGRIAGSVQLAPSQQEWKRLLHHFYDPFPVVEHFRPVT